MGGGADFSGPDDELLVGIGAGGETVPVQAELAFGTGSGDRTAIINSAVGLAKAAKAFDVSAVLSTVAAESFSGPIMPQLADVFPGNKIWIGRDRAGTGASASDKAEAARHSLGDTP